MTLPTTLGELQQTEWASPVRRRRTVKDEMRENLICLLENGTALFPGIVGYEETVIPQLVNALLARHNFILLGLRGQAKSRILRQLVTLLDEEIPILAGSEVNDDPFRPISKYGRELIAERGDDAPVAWLPRDSRFVEKLATPDVTIADIIGDVDPIKAARGGHLLSDELTMHFGLLPRANRGIFAVNELPDLAGKIQVGLFNIMQEGDVQIKGYPVRLNLDVALVFTANRLGMNTDTTALFDSDLYGVATTAFGSESDVDRNGVVIVLFSPEVNRLTPTEQCASSVITGYFFGIDIDPAFQTDPRSNRGEVFYAVAPDPAGTVTCTLSSDGVRRLVPVTFIHEFQHMISYYQHVLVRNASSEVLWLNEGLSHISEELAGLHFEAKGQDTLFSRFAIGDLYNGYLYLSNPGASFTLPLAGTGTLEERGAAWLFLRWLLDQYGPGATRRLVETSQTGATNVATVVGVPFDRLITQWFLANWVSDLPGFTAPSRLRYTTWAFRTTYASLNTQLPSRFTKPFPIDPPIASPLTVQLDGTLHAGSGESLRLRQAPGDGGFTLRLTQPGGTALPTSVVGRLNVIRVR